MKMILPIVLLMIPSADVSLPKTNDKTLQNIYSKKLTFYKPSYAYQLDGGVHDMYYNISALKPSEPSGNPNVEFPWANTGGTHRCTNDVTVKHFYHIPNKIKYQKGNLLRWDYFVQDGMPGFKKNHDYGVSWTYPENTIFGEILYNKRYPFEIRIRHKANNKWQPNVYRPIKNREEYDFWLGFYGVKSSKPNIRIKTLKNSHPYGNTFNSTAAIDILPKLDERIVKKLLALPFKSVRGKTWATHKGIDGFAPTTNADFHIVPKYYDGGFIEISQKSCMRCHSDTLKEVNEFQPRRDWYGRVRGSDGIFSFDIFDESCISSIGDTLPIVIRNKK